MSPVKSRIFHLRERHANEPDERDAPAALAAGGREGIAVMQSRGRKEEFRNIFYLC